MPAIVNILILLLGCAYSLYTGQLAVGFTFLLIYIVGLSAVWTFIRNRCSVTIYSLFFLIYGLLMILTQYLFIDGVYLGYFTHSDASGSFYVTATVDVGPNKWDELISGTLFTTFYFDYPLFALWINLWKLIGFDIGITEVNMRLFLRLQDLLFSPGILAIVAKYFQELGWGRKKTIRWCLVFGIFTYLFLTSVVYTRDLHIAFFYTVAGYYCLSPKKHRWIYLKFILIVLLSFGMRPENGMFAVIFPVYYRFRDVAPSVKLIIVGVVFIILVVALGYINTFTETMAGFNAYTLERNSGGLYAQILKVPFPFNLIINSYTFNPVYSFIMPFPITMFLNEDTISLFGIPSMAMPFINLIMVFSLIYYIRRRKNDYRTLYFFLICFLFITMCCTIEPNVRRTFAITPSIYMLYAQIRPRLPKAVNKRIGLRTMAFLLCLNVPAIVYLMINGKL